MEYASLPGQLRLKEISQEVKNTIRTTERQETTKQDISEEEKKRIREKLSKAKTLEEMVRLERELKGQA